MARSPRSNDSPRKTFAAKATDAAKSTTSSRGGSQAGKTLREAIPASRTRKPHGAKKLATKVVRPLGAKVEVVLSPRARGSSLAQEGTRAFTIGVQRVLHIASKKHTTVSVQGPDGKIVRGVPSRRDGTFVVVDDEARTSRASQKRDGTGKQSSR